MRILMKSLLTLPAVLFLAPTAALAYPPQCFEICGNVACWEECAVGPHTWMTCGDYAPSWCLGVAADPTAPSASVPPDEALQSDDASQVCSEDNQGTTAES